MYRGVKVTGIIIFSYGLYIYRNRFESNVIVTNYYSKNIKITDTINIKTYIIMCQDKDNNR